MTVEERASINSDEEEAYDSESSEPQPGKIKPAFYHDNGGIPVFKPTMEEFRNFSIFVENIKDYGLRAGIVKVIPPKEWKESLPKIPDYLLNQVQIRSAIKQEFQGTSGTFKQINLEQKKVMNIKEWKDLCEKPQHRTPPVSGDTVDSEDVSTASTPSDSLRLQDVLPTRRFPAAEDCTYYKELERIYWKNLTFFSPWYGADIKGSLFDNSVKDWNVARLPNLLLRIAQTIPGVNTPYLYFGMWKATFAWHVEDMDLYSINYIHFGAPKQWYAIPQAYRQKFERYCRNLFPQEYKKCSEFMRHKMYLMSPTVLARENIPVHKLVQEEGEFVLTFPYGYHAGYNIGYNCAESVNFAIDNWLEYGKKAKSCMCIDDSVKLNIDDLFDSSKRIGKSFYAGLCVLCGKEGSDDLIPLYPNPCPFAAAPAVAHRICADFIPECNILINDGSAYVVNYEDIPKDRMKLKCRFCKYPFGACIQCAKGKCVKSFHPWCAKENDLCMTEVVDQDGYALRSAYCATHNPNGKEMPLKQEKSTDIEAIREDIASAMKNSTAMWVRFYDDSFIEGRIIEDFKEDQLVRVAFSDVSFTMRSDL
jgi:hypothetical protein